MEPSPSIYPTETLTPVRSRTESTMVKDSTTLKPKMLSIGENLFQVGSTGQEYSAMQSLRRLSTTVCGNMVRKTASVTTSMDQRNTITENGRMMKRKAMDFFHFEEGLTTASGFVIGQGEEET